MWCEQASPVSHGKYYCKNKSIITLGFFHYFKQFELFLYKIQLYLNQLNVTENKNELKLLFQAILLYLRQQLNLKFFFTFLSTIPFLNLVLEVSARRCFACCYVCDWCRILNKKGMNILH